MRADDDLYRRGVATLLASWEEYARGSADAELRRLPGVAAAVFPHEPERSVYNNALLDRLPASSERSRALDAMESAYASAGVARFAAWVHETDHAMRDDLERRGYRIDTSTRAMGLELGEASLPEPRIDLAPPDWREHLRLTEVPPGFLAAADPNAYRVAVARLDGEGVATAMAFELDGDCGIYNVGTLEHARRRGLATAVTAELLRDAVARGCTTASLQATPVAEGLYGALGFRDLGRILEYVPEMPETDETQIEAVMLAFLDAVSFEAGDRPAYGDLPRLFTADARLIRTSGVEPEISTVDEFIRSRQQVVDAGELTSFSEMELAQRTELFGNVAHRFSAYAKRGTTSGGEIDTRGAISTQFVRMAAGWRISAMAWDDEREGLVLSPLG